MRFERLVRGWRFCEEAGDAGDAGGGAPPAAPPPADDSGGGSILGGGGGAEPPAPPPSAEDFFAALDDTVRDDIAKQGFKTPTDLAKSFIETKKMVGSRIPVPDKEDAEGLAEIYDKLGRPEAPDKYEFERDPEWKNLPEGLDEEMLGDFRKIAHEEGLSQRQAARFHNWYMGRANESVGAVESSNAEARASAEAALKQELGQAYEERISQANEFVDKLGVEGFKELLDSGVGNQPAMVRAIVKLAGMFENDKAFALGHGNPTGALTPKEAEGEIQALYGDPEFQKKWMDKHHPEHQAAVQKMNELFAAKTSGSGR